MLIDARKDKSKEMRHWLLPKSAHVCICGIDSEVESDMYTTCCTAYKARKNFRLRIAALYGYPASYIEIFIDELICTGNARKENTL